MAELGGCNLATREIHAGCGGVCRLSRQPVVDTGEYVKIDGRHFSSFQSSGLPGHFNNGVEPWLRLRHHNGKPKNATPREVTVGLCGVEHDGVVWSKILLS